VALGGEIGIEADGFMDLQIGDIGLEKHVVAFVVNNK
jgi:hypothetical protein